MHIRALPNESNEEYLKREKKIISRYRRLIKEIDDNTQKAQATSDMAERYKLQKQIKKAKKEIDKINEEIAEAHYNFYRNL